MRRTVQLVSDPTVEEIAKRVAELGLSNPNKAWITDLFQCFSAENVRDALAKPSSWQIEGDNAIDIRERKKMEQLLLITIVKNNQIDGDELTKAIINAFKLLDFMDNSKTKFDQLIPGKEDSVKIEDVIRGMEKAVEEINKIRNEQDPLIAELLGIPEDEYPEQALAKLDKKQRKILDLLSQVNEIRAIKVGSFPTQIEDEESIKKKELLISSFEQVSKVPLAQRIGPLHEYKLATKQYSIIQGVRTIESKQILVVLIDDSGSMRHEEKQSWIKAILLNRIASVLDGRSELYVARFEQKTRGFVKISTREEAREYYINYAFGSGGMTAIGSVLQKIALDLINHRIEQFPIESKLQPHILIINDGEDDVDPTFKINSIVHAFVLGTHNHNLRTVVERSTGYYTEVTIGQGEYI